MHPCYEFEQLFHAGNVCHYQNAIFAQALTHAGWVRYMHSPGKNFGITLPGKGFVIRTADGRYAKLGITCKYKNGVTPDVNASLVQKTLAQFFHQFRFIFQPNGTGKFWW